MPSTPALLCLLLLFAAPARADDPPKKDVAAAEAALKAGRLAEARDLFSELYDAADASGAGPETWAPLARGLAASLLGLGETYQALPFLEALARAGAPDDRLLYAESLVRHVREDLGAAGTASALRGPYLADALVAAEGVPAGGPLEDRRLAVVGEAHDLAGRTEQAVAAWQAAALGDPPTAEQRYARERLAHALYRLGRHKESAAAYASIGNRRGAAAAWGAAREAEKALALYAVLLAETPDDAALLADAIAVARFAGGQERLDAILAGMPGTGERAAAILRARARLAEQKNDFAGALVLLRAARAAAPALSAGLAVDIARVLVRSASGGQAAREEAAAVLLEAWKAAPGDAGLRDLMLAIAAQDFSDAWRAWPDRRPLERSVALQRAVLQPGTDDDPLAWANLGNTLRLAGDTQGAVAALKSAVILAPEDAAARNDLGLALSAAGQAAQAVEAFRRAVAADGAFLAGLQNLARALWRQGDDAGAARLLAAAEDSARATGASWMLYRVLGNRAWRTQHRPDRR